MDQTRTIFTSQRTTEIHPKNPKRKQYVEYRNYKLFEAAKSHVLEMSGNQDELRSLTIEQLLQAYADVEKMYTLRDIYRKKYFTPEQWDAGHEHRFTYLISVMDIYRDQLKLKFRDELERQVSLKRETEQQQQQQQPVLTQPSSQVEIYELGSTIQKIDKDIQQKTQEEVNIWNSIIPQMINERRVILGEKKQIFEDFRNLFYNEFIVNNNTLDKFFSFDETMFCITHVGAKFANRVLPSPNVKFTLTVDDFIVESPYFKDAQSVKDMFVKTQNKLKTDQDFKNELQDRFIIYRFSYQVKQSGPGVAKIVYDKLIDKQTLEEKQILYDKLLRVIEYKKKFGKR